MVHGTTGTTTEGQDLNMPNRATATDQVLEYAKTIAESDVYIFAGITGDFSPVHTNAVWMGQSKIGERIAHGVLTAGLMSAASSRWVDRFHPDEILLSYGYDRMRFIRPVRFGDTVTVTVTFREWDREKEHLVCDIEAMNQHGEVVAAAQHILAREKGDSSE